MTEPSQVLRPLPPRRPLRIAHQGIDGDALVSAATGAAPGQVMPGSGQRPCFRHRLDLTLMISPPKYSTFSTQHTSSPSSYPKPHEDEDSTMEVKEPGQPGLCFDKRLPQCITQSPIEAPILTSALSLMISQQSSSSSSSPTTASLPPALEEDLPGESGVITEGEDEDEVDGAEKEQGPLTPDLLHTTLDPPVW